MQRWCIVTTLSFFFVVVVDRRYASLGAHEEKDQSRKDDLESLLYVFLDLYTGKLPWAEHVSALVVVVAAVVRSCLVLLLRVYSPVVVLLLLLLLLLLFLLVRLASRSICRERSC